MGDLKREYMREVDAKRFYTGIYARLSNDGGERKNESIETQIAIARAYMAPRPDMVLYDCYLDLGRSGTSFRREGFARLMEDVRAGRVNCVIVKDLSRFGRNYIESGNYIQRIFPFLGVRFVAVADGFDSLCCENDDMGVNLRNLTNEMYARDIALKVASAKRIRKKAGNYVGGIEPYGCRIVRAGEGRSLSLREDTAPVVREIFKLCGEGESVRGIVRRLYEKQVHRPSEYRLYRHVYRQDGEALYEWSPASVREVLRNPVCAAASAAVCVAGNKKEGVHTARENEHAAARRESREDPYSGVLYCGVCNRRLSRVRSGGGCRYFCRNASRVDGLRCEGGRIGQGELTALVKEALSLAYALDEKTFSEIETDYREGAQRRREEIKRRRDALQKRKKNADYERGMLYARYREGGVSEAEYGRQSARSARRARELERDAKREEEKLYLSGRKEREDVRYLKERLLAWGEPDKALIAAVFSKILLYPAGRLLFVYTFACPVKMLSGEEPSDGEA